MTKLNEVEAVGLTEMETEMARRKYAAYFLLANAPEAKLYPHVKIICDAIQKIIDGQQQFLIIELAAHSIILFLLMVSQWLLLKHCHLIT